MQVVLKVVGGKNDGREIAIAVPRFVIGRGETAHLRPASDLVSREHCAIEVRDGKVTIHDLASRNGTFVNGNQLTETHAARAGDSLRIGRLQFQILIDPVKASAKKPKVSNVVEAAARTASQKKASLEDSITDWLLEAGDDDDGPDTNEKQIISSAETIQLNLDETTAIQKEAIQKEAIQKEAIQKEAIQKEAGEEEAGEEEVGENEHPESSGPEEDTEAVDDAKLKKKKPKPQKLPPLPKFQHESSTSAADDVLRKFFNRR